MTILRIENVIVCDDVRVEVNKKHILIGVYLGTIVVPDYPANITLCWWVEFMPTEIGKFKGEMRIVGENNTVLINGSIRIEITDLIPAVFPMERVPMQAQSDGKIRLEWRFGQEEWQTVKEMRIMRASLPQSISSPPTASPPPS